MQHQSQDFNKKSIAGKTGILDSRWEISSADIERHIALGKQMQAEAIAAFLTAGFQRLGRLFSRPAGRKPESDVAGLHPLSG